MVSRGLLVVSSVSLNAPSVTEALLAQELGLGRAVCSPQEASQLRQICRNNFLWVCPRVRPKETALGDQKRSLTPSEAIAARAADRPVIGRPIIEAPNLAAAFEAICQEIASVV
jgi:orotidine-5'-phosphate decarboxylase